MKAKVWAHRGASAYAPENTLSAFKKAIEMGADGIELDVQMTKDGELVVIHDETINRTSNGNGYVKDYTLAALKQYIFDNGFDGYNKERIPTLREVYKLMKDTTLTINVELKNGIILYKGIEEAVLKLAEEMGMTERIIYSSFNHYSMRRMKELAPTVQAGILFSDGWIDVSEYGRKLGVDALHPAFYHLQEPHFIQKAKENHLAVHVWTVNKEKKMVEVLNAGVDAIITNKPDLGRKVVDEYYSSK